MLGKGRQTLLPVKNAGVYVREDLWNMISLGIMPHSNYQGRHVTPRDSKVDKNGHSQREDSCVKRVD